MFLLSRTYRIASPGTKNNRFLACLILASCHAQAAHTGGTLHLTASGAAGTIDPQINYEEKFNQLFAFLQDGLVTFRKAAGDAGRDVVPDLAEAMPTVQDSGRRYVFRLRRGVRFSTGREVVVADVIASLSRMFQVHSPNVATWYSGIVGADACLHAARTCQLAGVTGDAATRTITIRLVRPNGEFLQQLAMSFACILPAETPGRDLGTTPAASTGPYMVESYDPTREMRIVRNPFFVEWSHDAQPAGLVDGMLYRFGLQDESEVSAVENGTQDWMFDEKPLDRLPEIGSAHAGLAHVSRIAAYYYLALNTRLAPFDRVAARRAVSFAVNRRALVNLFGGTGLASPTCQLLPEGIPGFAAFCPFTRNPGTVWSAPDLAQARALVRQSGTAGMRVTVITSDKEVERTIGIYLQSVLADIGYDAHVRAVSSNIAFVYSQNSSNHVQLSLEDFYQDYPAASDFLQVMYGCASFHPGSDSSINMAGYCDPQVDAEMDRAMALEGVDDATAVALWRRVDQEITESAPGIGLFQVNMLDLVSARVGGFAFSPIYHMLFSQTWVR